MYVNALLINAIYARRAVRRGRYDLADLRTISRAARYVGR